MTTPLNRHAPKPLYRQLVDILEAELADRYEPGDRLPSEAELAASFEVNRLTVRQALADLTLRGLVTTIQGKGSFAAAPSERYEVSPSHGASFTRAMRESDRIVEVRFISRERDDDPVTRRALRTRGGLIRVRQLRLVDGSPWSLTTTWLPLARFRRIEERWEPTSSLFDLLESAYGVTMVRANRTFAAVSADSIDAEHLMLPVGAPILLVKGMNVTQVGDPAAIVQHRMRGDRVEFSVDLA